MNPALSSSSSSSSSSLLPPDSSTHRTPSTALPDTNEEKISVTVCIQLTQIICHHRLPDRRPTIHPYRLAFGLSNGRIIIVLDCTVRLWELNPWHESADSNKSMNSSRKFSSSNNSYNTNNNTNNNSRSNKSLCLAVYRCHASPCIGLTIAPPVKSVINMVAGNPRLSVSYLSYLFIVIICLFIY
ncbi:unnamed protein product [Trichobilharzia regenti]|nr:unnamed protein product [Trichobilharzia regenti]